MGRLLREIDVIDVCLIGGMVVCFLAASAVCFFVAFDFEFPLSRMAYVQ